jgi:HAD superfamily hydrolase (TIGR01509 family)
MNDRFRLKDTMRQFHAVIFDMDGLLLDTERIALSAFVETCEHFGIGEQTALFMRCIGTNRASGQRVLKQGLEGKVDHSHFGHIWETNYIDRTSNTPIALKDGATELLEQLASLSTPLAVATSTDSVRATQKLRDAGILDRFSVVVGGDQVANSKPHPDIYLSAAAILGVSASKCLALEDSENGVRSAVSAGMTVVQVPDLAQPSPGLRALGHIVLDTLRDVSTHAFAGPDRLLR